ncbi:hypothetical protein PsYK624_167700 [Phanerochaete sordida]|uniref:Uncharacterized protein n=1 Tax=Phanerochaete sordida TaxID=48140 RepID=A0A9P3LME5_9APHY|nr:hypothetical protein PsYK624_167700 [Phanerochaete sordida]
MQALHPRTTIKNFHDALMDPKNMTKLALFAVVWAVLCVGDGFWIYYYVHGIVYPLPRNALDRNGYAWMAFTIFMFIFGFCLSIFNAIMSIPYLIVVWPKRKQPLSWAMRRFRVYLMWFSVPVLLFLAIMPFCGGWIVVPIVAQHVWNHGCDSFPAFAILDARSATDTSSVLNRVYFYMNQPSARSPTQLFTLTLTDFDSENWLLNLTAWNAPQASIPLDFYPTLHAVRYNLTASTLAGNCTLRTGADTPGTTTAPCMSGTFDSGDHLAFTISSDVPLNTTLAASYPPAPNTTTHLAIPDVGWSFGQPAVRLEAVQPDGELGQLVLATTVTRPHDVTQLKVCVAGPPGRPAAAVQPEVLAPLGLILMRQINYAVVATQPTEND